MNDDYKYCKKCGSKLEGFKCPVCDYHPSLLDNPTTTNSNPFAGPLIILIIIGYIGFNCYNFGKNIYEAFINDYAETTNVVNNQTITTNQEFTINHLTYKVNDGYNRYTNDYGNVISIPIRIVNYSDFNIYHTKRIVKVYFNDNEIKYYQTYADDDFTKGVTIYPDQIYDLYLNLPDYGEGNLKLVFTDDNINTYTLNISI